MPNFYPYLRVFVLTLASAALLAGCGGAGGGGNGTTTGGRSAAGGGSAGACATSVTGKVIGENPRTESPGLAFSAGLGSLGTTVTVSGLDGTCALRNPTISVTTDRQYPSAIASVGAGLSFTPNDPQFQQVSTYYYATKARDQLDLAGAGLSTGLLGVSFDAHCINYFITGVAGDQAENNAFFLPSSKHICLGYTFNGGKRLYAADDADVIIHEFGHAINHNLSSTEIMNSSLESGAIDEGVADYWALTTNNNAALSEWFLGSIDAVDVVNADPYYQRVASENYLYPQTASARIHFDSRPLAQALWTIRGSLGATKTDKLVVRMMDTLPNPARFRDAVVALESAALTVTGITAGDRTVISTTLTNKGLKRTDSSVGVAVSDNPGKKSIYVIDDHSYSVQVGGNCDGVLDVGETAIVMVNLESSGSILGLAIGTASTASAGVSFVSGGNVAEYMRLNGGGADFVDVLRTASVASEDATLYASYLIRATTSGVKAFTMNFSPMGGAAVSIPFNLTVGTSATRATNCPGGATVDRTLWPDP